eukprot:4839956-Prymnesium_polylepis.1
MVVATTLGVLLALAVRSTSALRPAHPYCVRLSQPPARRAVRGRIVMLANDEYDWDAAWQQRVAATTPEPPATERATAPVPRSDLSKAEEICGASDRCEAMAYAMAKTDFFGTILAVTSEAWAMFYLVVVPAFYVLASALGLPDVSTVDVQTVARAVFLPGWPVCLVVASGVTLLRKVNQLEE